MAASQLALLSGRLSHDTARNFFVSLRTPWFGALRSAWCPDRISGSPITLDFPTGNSRRRELRRTCWPGALNIVCSDENADRVQSKQSDSSPMTNAEPVLSDQHPPSSVLVIILYALRRRQTMRHQSARSLRASGTPKSGELRLNRRIRQAPNTSSLRAIYLRPRR